MKSLIAILLLFAALPLRAQVTLEHAYSMEPNVGGASLELMQTDSNEWRYVSFYPNSIYLYDLRHVVVRSIPIHIDNAQFLIVIARHLFTADTFYSYLLRTTSNSMAGLSAFKEDGTL